MSWITRWFRWCPTSEDLLEKAEERILKYVKGPYDMSFINIVCHENQKEEFKIRSLTVGSDPNGRSTPLVLLHGFASGLGLWILNLDCLSEERPVYTFDILGFGRSSRPDFSKDAEVAEDQLVESIEQWRRKVNLDKFILLGHSMGGFLATSYAIKYPDKVKHLILADPWGFPEPDLSVKKIRIPFWAKIIATILRPFNPLAGLRAVGPWGPQLVQRLRPDIIGKFEHFVDDPSDVTNYIYHCNAQHPSGEAAFKAMTAQFGWAKRPMLNRISDLNESVPITFIYGSRSWVDSSSGELVKALRENSFVEIKVINGAGHHVYADKFDVFNRLVKNTCCKVDNEEIPCVLESIKQNDESGTDDEITHQNNIAV